MSNNRVKKRKGVNYYSTYAEARKIRDKIKDRWPEARTVEYELGYAVQYYKGGPYYPEKATMAKKRSAKQKAAFKKMQRGLSKWRRAHGYSNPRRRKKVVGRRIGARKVVRRTRPTRKIRAQPRSKVTRTRARRAATTGLFHVRDGRRYFTGTGFSASPASGAYFKSARRAATIARALSNKLGRPMGVYG